MVVAAAVVAAAAVVVAAAAMVVAAATMVAAAAVVAAAVVAAAGLMAAVASTSWAAPIASFDTMASPDAAPVVSRRESAEATRAVKRCEEGLRRR